LVLPAVTIQPSATTRYLGVIFDQHLNWKAQTQHAVRKGTVWTEQLRRLARPSTGLTSAYVRRLFIAVAIPKMLYAADVWCTPI
ncbi:hypothetical protein BV25DRAFT_1790450, partial [Artomyces pyxidatus]